MAVASPKIQPLYYSTTGGAEIDLILEFSNTERWAIEIKRSSSPTLSKGFYVACDDVKPQRRYVVYSGIESFPFKDGVTAISLSRLMEEVLKQE